MATDPRTIINTNEDPGLVNPTGYVPTQGTNNGTAEVKSVTINYTDPPLYGVPELQIFNDPGGRNGAVQFNVGNRLGGDSNFVWNSKNRTLSILGNIRISDSIIGKYNTNTKNLKITGGEDGYVLSTDGTGNISWIPAPSTTYGNNNVANYLPTYTGNVSANYFIGNGSQLTGLPTQYANSNVANYLPTYTGNLNGNSIIITDTGYIYNISSTGLASLTTVNVSSNLTTNAIYTNNYFYANGIAIPLVDGNRLINGDNSFVLDIDGNVVFQGTGQGNGVNRGLVWDYGAAGNGVNSQVRQDENGLTVRAWTESGPEPLNASVNIITNQNSNIKIWEFDGQGNLNLPGNLILPGSIQSENTGFEFSGTITNIESSYPAAPVITIAEDVFPDPVTGQVTIFNLTQLTGALQANGTYYYQAVYPNQFALYDDAGLTQPVDTSTWTAYLGGGGNAVAIGEYLNLSIQGGNVSISSNDQTWVFDTNGHLNTPAAAGSYSTGRIQSANGYPTLLAYGSNGHGGPEFNWMNGDNLNDMSNVNVLRNTMYLNDEGLYVGINENNVANTFTGNWKFDATGNLTLPGYTFAVNYVDGTPVILGGNTGNVTFSNATVQGDNTSLNLSTGADFTANLAYLQVRSGDVLSHIHLDTGNNEAYDLIVGNDQKYVQVSSTGNILMSSYDGNISFEWNLDNTGNLTLPNGGSLYSAPAPIAGNMIVINPHGSGSITNQKLMIYPTVGDGDHIHMSTGNLYETELFLGTDDFYVKLANTGNVIVNSNDGIGNTHSWTFDTNGNLTLPGNTFAVNYSNGTQASLGGSYSNSDVANYLPTYTGNLSANYFVGNGSTLTYITGSNINGNVTSSVQSHYANIANSVAGSNVSGQVSNSLISGTVYTNAQPNITSVGTLTSLTISGNVTANNLGNISSINLDGNVSNVLAGDGTWVTASAGGTNYGNSNVSTFLASFGSNTITTTGNISVGNIGVASITATANISTSGYFISGNQATGGFQLGNSNSRLKSGDSNSYMTMGQNPAIYPDTAASALAGVLIGGSGYILGPNGGRNITLNYGGTTGIVGLQANIQVGTGGSGTILVPGTVNTGVNSILAGPTFTPLANTMAGFVSNINSYTQLTIQNKNTGADATTDFVATADNGSDTVNYLDLGIINSGYDNGTPTNSLGNIVYAADSYIYAQGNTSATGQSGGNLAIGTTVASKTVKIFAGGVTSNSIVASFANTGANITGSLNVSGNITGANISGNISITGNIQGTSSNVSLVAGSYTMTFDNTGKLVLPSIGGDEGGEINFGIPASNTTLTTRVVVDVFQDRVRFFDGSTKGAYIDLSQAGVGVSTLLNNRVSGFVNAGTFVTMDLIKATVTTSGNRGLSLATTTGTFVYNIGGNFGMNGNGSGGQSLASQTLTTTATSSIFGWGFSATGDISTYILTDTTNSRCYRITVMIGASFNNNAITIERLI